jgi:HK97 family phage major capsid protein
MDEKKIKQLIEEQMEEQKAKDAEDKGEVKASNSEEKAEDRKVEASMDPDKLGEEIAEKIVGAIQEKLGGSDKDAEALKSKVYNPEKGLGAIEQPSLKELDNLTEKEKIATYYKSLIKRRRTNKDEAILKGLSEGTDADGGYLVPEPLYNEVYELLPDMAVMRRVGSEIEMTSQTLDIPTLENDGKAYWIKERKTKTTTSAEFGQKTLTAHKLVARILITEELNDDAIISMIPWINEQFAKYIATAEDEAFFTGSGVGQPRGITLETLSNQDVGSGFNFDDVIDLVELVRDSVQRSPDAAFIGHRQVITRMRKIKDDDGGYIWRNGGRTAGQTERLPDTALGYNVYRQNDLPTDRLYFGDWSKYLIGDRKSLAVRSTDTTDEAWSRDLIDIKAVERVDGRAILLGAFAYLDGIGD